MELDINFSSREQQGNRKKIIYNIHYLVKYFCSQLPTLTNEITLQIHIQQNMFSRLNFRMFTRKAKGIAQNSKIP